MLLLYSKKSMDYKRINELEELLRKASNDNTNLSYEISKYRKLNEVLKQKSHHNIKLLYDEIETQKKSIQKYKELLEERIKLSEKYESLCHNPYNGKQEDVIDIMKKENIQRANEYEHKIDEYRRMFQCLIFDSDRWTDKPLNEDEKLEICYLIIKYLRYEIAPPCRIIYSYFANSEIICSLFEDDLQKEKALNRQYRRDNLFLSKRLLELETSKQSFKNDEFKRYKKQKYETDEKQKYETYNITSRFMSVLSYFIQSKDLYNTLQVKWITTLFELWCISFNHVPDTEISSKLLNEFGPFDDHYGVILNHRLFEDSVWKCTDEERDLFEQYIKKYPLQGI